MLTLHRNKATARRGAAVVELAILLPVLCFFLVLSIDFGRVFYYSVTVASCARSGALYARDPTAAAESPYTSVADAALADAANLSPAPTVSSSNGVDAGGQPYVDVTVTYPFSTITNYPWIPSSLNVTHTVRMHVVSSVPSAN